MGRQRSWSGHGRATASARRLKTDQEPHSSSSSSSGTDHEEASSTSAGCMCAVFQLFDFHPLNQSHHHAPQSSVSSLSLNPISLPPDLHISTGTEAPRNSLESDEELPLPCTPKQNDDGLHIPKDIVQIKTRSRSGSKESSNNEGEINSPSTKTPTLVARLMGLDLLPQPNNSPSTTPRTTPSSVSPIYPLLQRPKSTTGSRSLPETPRTSCERKSNVENYHHRLSLQIPAYDKENSSPRHYAKEIVKQIKETVSRKSGLADITNYPRRDHEVMAQTKPKKVSSSTSSSLSPKLRVLEPRNNSNKLTSPKAEAVKGSKKVKAKKGNKQQEEPFVVRSRITKAAIDSPRKKSKQTPLSNQLLSFSSVPTVVMKKDPPFSSAKPPLIQSPCNGNQGAETVTGEKKESKRVLQLSTFHNNQQTDLHHQHVIQLPNNNNNHHIIPAAASGRRDSHDVAAEVESVRKILTTRTDFLEGTAQKEVPICHNGKLLSHLAEELLRPYVEARPWGCGGRRRWPEVVEKLCEQVRRYPRARCEVLEDIDGIIEKDMDRLGMGFEEEEGERIVRHIEEAIVDELLKETVRFAELHGVV